MDKERVNDVLRYVIRVIQGKEGWIYEHCRRNRVLLALSIRNQLDREGFWFQAQIIDKWIGRFHNGEFS